MEYYVVLDLEMCKVKRNATIPYKYYMEIIQLGAVLLDSNFVIVDSFNRYVAPKYGKLDYKIKELTGIDEKKIQGAPFIEDVIDDFFAWIGDKSVRMVSWSNSDMIQLQKEFAAKGINEDRFEQYYLSWIDSQDLFTKRVNTPRTYSLSEALIAADIEWVGNSHDGYYDAYNTALLFSKLMINPILELNETYLHCKEETVSLTYSMGDLMSKLNLMTIA